MKMGFGVVDELNLRFLMYEFKIGEYEEVFGK
jgi:hypothetical protein